MRSVLWQKEKQSRGRRQKRLRLAELANIHQLLLPKEPRWEYERTKIQCLRTRLQRKRLKDTLLSRHLSQASIWKLFFPCLRLQEERARREFFSIHRLP